MSLIVGLAFDEDNDLSDSGTALHATCEEGARTKIVMDELTEEGTVPERVKVWELNDNQVASTIATLVLLPVRSSPSERSIDTDSWMTR